jgi:hypothetical protein
MTPAYIPGISRSLKLARELMDGSAHRTDGAGPALDRVAARFIAASSKPRRTGKQAC